MLRILLLCSLLLPSSLFAASQETLYVPQPEMPAPGPNLKQTANFDELRHNILELISSSKKRVWLLTDYLTDGDIVSALFLAKYRKVDVKVFLGQSRLNSYLSRLNYLKAQNVPVFTRPEHGFIAPTVLFIDQRLFTINRDLNVLARQGSSQMAQASPSDVATFVNWFREVQDLPIPADARPLPAVGRSRPAAAPDRSWQGQGQPRQPEVSSYRGESDGAYNYDRSRLPRQAPPGVSTKLPRTLRWQKPEREDEPAASAKTPDGAALGPAAVPAKIGVPGPSGPAEITDRPGTDEEKLSPPSEER